MWTCWLKKTYEKVIGYSVKTVYLLLTLKWFGHRNWFGRKKQENQTEGTSKWGFWLIIFKSRAPTKKMWKSLKAASCRRTKPKRSIFTQKTMATGWSREISYRSAKTRCKILSSARGCRLLAVCVNLSCLFKNKLGLIFFRGLVFLSRILKIPFRRNPRNRGKMGALQELIKQCSCACFRWSQGSVRISGKQRGDRAEKKKRNWHKERITAEQKKKRPQTHTFRKEETENDRTKRERERDVQKEILFIHAVISTL